MTRKSYLILGIAAVAAVFFISRYGFAPAVANSPPPAGPIVALGDSLTAGFGVGSGEAFPDRLSELIGRPIVNAGVNGDTIAEGLARLDRDVLARKPGVVVVCLGGNDLLRRGGADDAFARLDTIVQRITDSGAMVVLVGIEGMAIVSADFGSRFEALAERHACLYIPDILDGIFGRSSLMQSDGIHPNAAGHRKMAERIAAKLESYL